MPDHLHSGENAVLIHINVFAAASQEAQQEFEELARSAQLNTVSLLIANCRTPHAKYFIGTGKANEASEIVKANKATCIVVNHDLSATQERNLEQLMGCRVIDRTGLILDIFAQRARTFEGKLQVELAQLQHLSTRLIRGWTHLERQKGGIGLRGPGETQLETDRRLIRQRIKTLKMRLEKVQAQRHQNRQSRLKARIPTIALVGYTNAGKSTLFNRLAHAESYVADQLFATLDPTLRRLMLPNQQKIVLADTVGFIRHLPHDLIAAFRATLLETQQADLLLHVMDVQQAGLQNHQVQVNQVLAQIGAEQIPQIEIYNKIDLLPAMTPQVEYNSAGKPAKVWLSASQGLGITQLRDALTAWF